MSRQIISSSLFRDLSEAQQEHIAGGFFGFDPYGDRSSRYYKSNSRVNGNTISDKDGTRSNTVATRDTTSTGGYNNEGIGFIGGYY